MKKVSEVTKYIKSQVGNPYWYGCYGQTATASLLKQKKGQYPERYDRSKFNQGWEHQYGQRVHDCVGLIKGALWSNSATSAPKYNASQDISADGMLAKCTEKGPFSTMPDEEGLLVFYSGHVGYYIGNGEVVEARGHNYGVVITRLSARGWKSWGRCPWIDYSEVGKTAVNQTTAKQSTTVNQSAAKQSAEKTSTEYFPKYEGNSLSIVDALKSLKVDSSFANRKNIATKNNIANYSGTSAQNNKILNLLKAGKLIKA